MSKRKLAESEGFRLKALAYKHTIFNLFPNTNGWLEQAKNDISKDRKEGALYCLTKTKNNYEILDICNRAIYNHIDNNHPLNDKKISEILQFLIDRHSVEKVKPQLIEEIDFYDPINYSPDLELISETFIVLWNFWHNATNRNSDNRFIVKLWKEENDLLVTFINKVPKNMLEKAA